MLFGRRKPGYTTTVDAAADPEQVILDLQKAEMAAKKKPKAEVFDIDAASETARRLKETGSMFDGSAAKLGEDVIAAVQKETDALAARQAEAQPALEETAVPDAAEKPQLLDFLAAAPEAEGDPYADQPTVTAPELPKLTPAQELAGYIRSRSAAALVTSHALLVSEVENADELLAQMPEDPQCADIVSRTGAKDAYYYSSANMSDNYAMIDAAHRGQGPLRHGGRDGAVQRPRLPQRHPAAVLPPLALRSDTGSHRADVAVHAGQAGVRRHRGADQQPERAVPLSPPSTSPAAYAKSHQ